MDAVIYLYGFFMTARCTVLLFFILSPQTCSIRALLGNFGCNCIQVPRDVALSRRRVTIFPAQPSYPLQLRKMSSDLKQERDYTPEVDLLLPEAAALAKVRSLVACSGSEAHCRTQAGKLEEAAEKLLALEKQTRNVRACNGFRRHIADAPPRSGL